MTKNGPGKSKSIMKGERDREIGGWGKRETLP